MCKVNHNLAISFMQMIPKLTHTSPACLSVSLLSSVFFNYYLCVLCVFLLSSSLLSSNQAPTLTQDHSVSLVNISKAF